MKPAWVVAMLIMVLMDLTGCKDLINPQKLFTEKDAEEIINTQTAGMKKYEELERQRDPSALLRTVEWLKAQPRVKDSGISEDGNIWIEYNIGLRGFLILNLPISGEVLLNNNEVLKSGVTLATAALTTTSRENPSIGEKAIILLPFNKQMTDEVANEVRVLLESIGYRVEVVENEDVTLERMKRLGEYRVIYITTHGGFDWLAGVSIVIGEKVTRKFLTDLIMYWKQFLSGVGIANISGDKNTYLTVNGRFINNFKYPNSLVVVHACNSLRNDTLADAFLKSGAAVYFGWTDTGVLGSWGSYQLTRGLFQELVKPNITVSAAYKNPSIYPVGTNIKHKFSIDDLFPVEIYKGANNDNSRRICYSDLEAYPQERCPGDPDAQKLDWKVDFRYKGDGNFVLNPVESSSPEPGCTVTLHPGDSIQETIARVRPGSVICLTAGTWEENIEIKKDLTLRGASREQTKIKGKEEYKNVITIASDSEITVGIERLTVAEAKGAAGIGIRGNERATSGKARVTLSSSQVSNNESYGIMLWGLVQVSITNSQVSNNGVGGGIELTDSAQVSITDSQILNNKAGGIDLSNSARASIANSQISSNKEHGVGLGHSAQVSITNSQVSNNGTMGIALEGSAQASITNSQVSNNGGYGIHLGGSAQASITSSQVSNNRWVGIELWNSARAELRGSVIEGNGKDEGCTEKGWYCNGISVSHESQLKLINSQVLKNADWGVWAALEQCGYGDFSGKVTFEDMKLEDISGNNTTGNQDGMGNPGNHPWNRPDVLDGQVCLP